MEFVWFKVIIKAKQALLDYLESRKCFLKKKLVLNIQQLL